jgi:hypothetical protein
LTDRHAYWSIVKRPLQILAFLLPLIILYELALTFLLQSQQSVQTVLAHRYLLQFFDAFNITPQGGLHMGGIAIIVVLLVWHVLERTPWKISYKACGFMALESIVLVIPLLVLSQIITRTVATSLATSLQDLDKWSQVSISIGAGLYEELMFRMLLIAIVHTLLVDVGKASHQLGAIIAVVVSAAAFAWYHPLKSSSDTLFYFLAGLYFGAIYVVRGFGIVVAVHAFYDIVTFWLLSPARAS